MTEKFAVNCLTQVLVEAESMDDAKAKVLDNWIHLKKRMPQMGIHLIETDADYPEGWHGGTKPWSPK